MDAEFPPAAAGEFAGRFRDLFDRHTFTSAREELARKAQLAPPVLHPDSQRAHPLDGRIACECPVSRPAELPRLAYVPAPWKLLPEVRSPKQRRIDRKVSLIRRSGLFGANTKGARISRAATLEDLRDAYKLVHRIYLGSGFISEEQAEMRLRIFETSPNTATFIAKKDGRVVGVLSIVHDSEEFGLPSDEAFADELHGLRATGRKLGEVTNQAVDEKFRGTAVPTELMRCALAHGIAAGFDLGIAAVSPSHNAFYELLGFRQIGGRRSYSGKIHDPVVPLQIDLAEHRNPQRRFDEVEEFMHSFLTAENPYVVFVESWENAARERFRDPGLLRGLFVQERNFISECSAKDRAALHQHWGNDLFSQVTGALFLPPLGPLVPDLADIDAPAPDRLSLPPHSTMSSLVPGLEAVIACGAEVKGLGGPDAGVRKANGERHDDAHSTASEPEHQHSRFTRFSPVKRVRDWVLDVCRTSAVRTPREAH